METDFIGFIFMGADGCITIYLADKVDEIIGVGRIFDYSNHNVYEQTIFGRAVYTVYKGESNQYVGLASYDIECQIEEAEIACWEVWS